MHPYYDIPESVEELFMNGDRSYIIIDYDIDSMNNVESMNFFLDLINATDDDIVLYDGTQVYLKNAAGTEELKIDAGGLGDFYSHSFDVTIVS